MTKRLMLGLVGLLALALASWAAESPDIMKTKKLEVSSPRLEQPAWQVERDPKKLPMADGPLDRAVDLNGSRQTESKVQDNYALRSGLGVLGPTVPGRIIASTSWDLQHNDAAPHMIGVNGSEKFVHFTWTGSDVIPTSLAASYRFVNVNDYNSGTGMFCLGTAGIVISEGLGGDPIAAHGGFTTLGVDGLDRMHVAYHQHVVPHQSSADYSSTVSDQLIPCYFAFCDNELSPSAGAVGNTNDDVIYPHVTVDPLGGDTDLVHVLAHTYASNDNILYWRGKLGPCATWVGPYLVDSSPSLSYNVAADRTSGKCAIVTENNWTTATNPSGSMQIVYRESSSNGDDWGPVNTTGLGNAKRFFVTNYNANTGPEAWLDVVGDYDNGGKLHIIWIERKDPFNRASTQAALKHWDKTSLSIRTAALGYWDNAGYIGGRKINFSFPSLGFGDGTTTCGTGTNLNYLYVTYTQFGGNSLAEQNDKSAKDFMNGDVYLASSKDGGATWAPPVNLTNRKTPGCDPAKGDSCGSEDWPSIARNIDDTIHIQYVADRDAGDAPLGNGSWTYNPLMYYRIAGGANVAPICPACAPVLVAELSRPSSPDCEYHTPPNTSITATLTLKNLGNCTLFGSVSKQYISPPTGSWLTVNAGSFTILAGGADIQYLVVMNATGLAEGLYSAKLVIAHNDGTQVSPIEIPIDFFVFTDFHCPETATLHTSRNFGDKVLELEVSNVERIAMARYVNLKGLLRTKDRVGNNEAGNNAIFDGSLIISKPPTDITKPPDGVLDTIVYRYLFGQGNYAKGFRGLTGLEVNTSAYGSNQGSAWAKATQTTIDSTIGIEVEYDFPQNADSSDFVLIKYRLYNRTNSTISGLMAGEAVDFDVVPSLANQSTQAEYDNTSGFVNSMNLIYQQGVDAGATTVAQKYQGGMTAIQCTPAPRAWTASNAEFLFHRDGHGFSEGYLYQQMVKTGFEIIPPDPPPASGGTDLHSAIVFEKNITLAPTADKHYILGLVSSVNGPATTDLVSSAKKAWKYAFGWQEIPTTATVVANTPWSARYYASGSHENGPASGCCGCVITKVSGDPLLTITPDASPCTGTINFAGSPTAGTYAATFRITTPACTGPQYTDDHNVYITVVPDLNAQFCLDAPVIYSTVGVTNMKIVEINGDAKPDIVVGSSWLKNHGNGGFDPMAPFSGPIGGWSCSGKLDANQSSDFATTWWDPDFLTSGVDVYLNNGSGSYSGRSAGITGGMYDGTLFSADLNGDGVHDLIAASGNSDPAGTISVSLNDGNATGWTTTTTNSLPLDAFVESLVAEDLDGDHDIDLAFTLSTGQIGVMKNLGGGNFGALSLTTVGADPRSLCAGDFNGDGYPDLAFVQGVTNPLKILINSGSGTFPNPAQSYPALGVTRISVADFDSDGDPDVAAIGLEGSLTRSSILLYLNEGGLLVGHTIYGSGLTMLDFLDTGDLDGNGSPDIVVSDYAHSQTAVLLNCHSVTQKGDLTEDGNLDVFDVIAIIDAAFSGGQATLAVGDINCDGLIDVFDVIALIGIVFSSEVPPC